MMATNRPVARFATRDEGNYAGKIPLMIIGWTQIGGLKPGMVYEVQEILGELVVVEIGPSCLRKNNSDERDLSEAPYEAWSCSVENLIFAGSHFVLTPDEYKVAYEAGLIK